jgi:hypothetical protein
MFLNATAVYKGIRLSPISITWAQELRLLGSLFVQADANCDANSGNNQHPEQVQQPQVGPNRQVDDRRTLQAHHAVYCIRHQGTPVGSASVFKHLYCPKGVPCCLIIIIMV